MDHKIKAIGYGYALRPVTIQDAQFIIDVRLEDQERNQYIHKISRDISAQKQWIVNYLKREGDYYFIIENILTGTPEGLIAIYDIEDNRAEWGRWVVKKGSMASVESVNLLYQIAFEKLKLQELFSRTIEDNASVILFHDSIGQKNRGIKENFVSIDHKKYNVIEQYVDAEYYHSTIKPLLTEKCQKIFIRNFRAMMGGFEFHHIGVCTANITNELLAFQMLGYKVEGNTFLDENQGIKGQFLIAKGQPRIELLENLPGSSTLNYYLENNIKLYHFAYYVDNIEKIIELFSKCRARIISPLKESIYFKKRICFLVLPNKYMIELIEKDN